MRVRALGYREGGARDGGEVSGENTMESLRWGSDIDKGDSSGLGYSVWYKSSHIENNI